jgi:hypothetical protein
MEVTSSKSPEVQGPGAAARTATRNLQPNHGRGPRSAARRHSRCGPCSRAVALDTRSAVFKLARQCRPTPTPPRRWARAPGSLLVTGAGLESGGAEGGDRGAPLINSFPFPLGLEHSWPGLDPERRNPVPSRLARPGGYGCRDRCPEARVPWPDGRRARRAPAGRASGDRPLPRADGPRGIPDLADPLITEAEASESRRQSRSASQGQFPQAIAHVRPWSRGPAELLAASRKDEGRLRPPSAPGRASLDRTAQTGRGPLARTRGPLREPAPHRRAVRRARWARQGAGLTDQIRPASSLRGLCRTSRGGAGSSAARLFASAWSSREPGASTDITIPGSIGDGSTASAPAAAAVGGGRRRRRPAESERERAVAPAEGAAPSPAWPGLLVFLFPSTAAPQWHGREEG